MYGYGSRILRVDLTRRKTETQTFDAAFARRYVGGNGFAARLLADSLSPETDPLSAENAVVLAAGPLTATPIWGTSRGHLASLSPQTGYLADSDFGGDFGTHLKRTGHDALFITGASESPVYLLVTEEGAEIKDADHLWGKGTTETMERLAEAEGRQGVSAVIGPAGENLVVFAGLAFGGSRIGNAGRCGMGAVLGSKRLKAVVARGGLRPEIARPAELKELLRASLAGVRENTAVLTRQGTPFLVDFINGRGMLGTHNNTRETFASADRINAESVQRQYAVRNVACLGCPVACGKAAVVDGRKVKLPEYETLYALGSMLDLGDLSAVVRANALCDELGMDTISTGVTLSFLAECQERAIATERDLGARVAFGDGEGLIELIEAAAYRRGVGELIARGSEQAARELGPEAARYLNSVRGLEMAGHSARGLRTLGLGYATSTRGGSHHDTRPNYADGTAEKDPDALVAYNIRSQNLTAVGDSLILCRFVGERGFKERYAETMARLLSLVTGWDVDEGEIETIGERIYQLERLVNVSRGAGRTTDTLPFRIMNEPIPEGPAAGSYMPRSLFSDLLDLYYERRGWTPDGKPGSEKLKKLGLEAQA